MQRIKDIMTPNPRTCTAEHTLDCSLQIMRDINCGAVPIVDNEQKIQGMITDRDIALCLLKNEKSPNQLRIRDCAHMGQVITIKPDDEVHRAVTLMEENQIRRLPVVDDQMRCIGIVAQADLALKNENKGEVAELVQEVSKRELHKMGSNP